MVNGRLSIFSSDVIVNIKVFMCHYRLVRILEGNGELKCINLKVKRTERIERHGVSWLTFSKLKLLQMEQGDETMARMTSARQGYVQQHRSNGIRKTYFDLKKRGIKWIGWKFSQKWGAFFLSITAFRLCLSLIS
ncbi:hypothetical protein P8452_52857 [Trifolium repens]|nr:hypothetical protein P8452_52857 [Trifolium repens]